MAGESPFQTYLNKNNQAEKQHTSPFKSLKSHFAKTSELLRMRLMLSFYISTAH